ncbi:MAG: TrkA C-terminal domain-containing protein [Trebonia sp.]
MGRPLLVMSEHVPSSEALDLLRTAGLPGAPVVDADGSYLGTVETARLAGKAAGGTPVSAFADVTASSVAASAALDTGLEALMHTGGQWLTVTGGDRYVAGILSAADLVRGYQQLPGASAGRLAPVTRHAVAMDMAVGKNAPVAGQAIRDAGLPPGSVIVAIRRQDRNVPVNGGTVIEEGDMLSMFASPDRLGEVSATVRGPGQPGDAGARRGPAGVTSRLQVPAACPVPAGLLARGRRQLVEQADDRGPIGLRDLDQDLADLGPPPAGDLIHQFVPGSGEGDTDLAAVRPGGPPPDQALAHQPVTHSRGGGRRDVEGFGQ